MASMVLDHLEPSLAIAIIVITALFTNPAVDHTRCLRCFNDHFNIFFPCNYFQQFSRQQLHFFGFAQLWIFQQGCDSGYAPLLQQINIVFHLGNMRVFHLVRFFYFVYYLALRIVIIDHRHPQINFGILLQILRLLHLIIILVALLEEQPLCRQLKDKF